METKKRLIVRLALACLALLAVSLAALTVAQVRRASGERDREYERRQRREAAVERSRKYLGELAHRVTKLPVDPAVLAEVESRYFEEIPRGRMHVWAMGRDGEFLFGVPREAFSKLNAVYDRDVLPRLKDGVYLDRQTFLRRLADESEGVDAETFAPPEEPPAAEDEGRPRRRGHADAAWARFEGREDDPNRFVLSTPLRAPDGQALGSIYSKTTLDPVPWGRDEVAADIADVAAVGVGASLFGLWMLLPTWVFVDARSRGVRRAALYAFLTVLSAVIGLVVYLIARPEDPSSLPCPGCGKDVDGGAYCPHCGHDLSAAFCASCRYPLKADWVYCPACRTEIKPQPAAATPETVS
jgi:hypothetical protein